MNFLLRAILAIVCGAIATALLEWAGWFNHGLDVLIGVVVALVVYLSREP